MAHRQSKWFTMRTFPAILLMLSLSACGTMGGEPVFVVDAHNVQPGMFEGTSFKVKGSHGYDKVWNAAIVAMSKDMTVIESHKPSGVIKSRVGSAPSGKIVGFYITPTAPKAIEYRIETNSIRPIGINSVNGRGWEPSVVEAFNAALNAK